MLSFFSGWESTAEDTAVDDVEEKRMTGADGGDEGEGQWPDTSQNMLVRHFEDRVHASNSFLADLVDSLAAKLDQECRHREADVEGLRKELLCASPFRSRPVGETLATLEDEPDGEEKLESNLQERVTELAARFSGLQREADAQARCLQEVRSHVQSETGLREQHDSWLQELQVEVQRLADTSCKMDLQICELELARKHGIEIDGKGETHVPSLGELAAILKPEVLRTILSLSAGKRTDMADMVEELKSAGSEPFESAGTTAAVLRELEALRQDMQRIRTSGAAQSPQVVRALQSNTQFDSQGHQGLIVRGSVPATMPNLVQSLSGANTATSSPHVTLHSPSVTSNGTMSPVVYPQAGFGNASKFSGVSAQVYSEHGSLDKLRVVRVPTNLQGAGGRPLNPGLPVPLLSQFRQHPQG